MALKTRQRVLSIVFCMSQRRSCQLGPRLVAARGVYSDTPITYGQALAMPVRSLKKGIDPLFSSPSLVLYFCDCLLLERRVVRGSLQISTSASSSRPRRPSAQGAAFRWTERRREAATERQNEREPSLLRACVKGAGFTCLVVFFVKAVN